MHTLEYISTQDRLEVTLSFLVTSDSYKYLQFPSRISEQVIVKIIIVVFHFVVVQDIVFFEHLLRAGPT